MLEQGQFAGFFLKQVLNLIKKIVKAFPFERNSETALKNSLRFRGTDVNPISYNWGSTCSKVLFRGPGRQKR